MLQPYRRPSGYARRRMNDEERIALFLDYENLAIGAREDLGGMKFDLKPVAAAPAPPGRGGVGGRPPAGGG
jgi:hypothetical protein